MKIGINAHFATRLPRRGIGTYALNLIRNVVSISNTDEFYIYIRHPDTEHMLPVAPNIHIRQLFAPLDPLWEQVALPIAAYKDRVDVLHSLGNTGPIFLPKKIHHVLSLMDVMFLQSGNSIPTPVTLYQKIGKLYRSFVAPRCAKKSTTIITISEFSKQEIIKHIIGIAPSLISVIYLASDPMFCNPIKPKKINFSEHYSFLPNRPYILCLGAEDPRKNTLRIVSAYLKLIKDSSIEENLYIVGYKNWEHSKSFELVTNANAIDRVFFLPFVSIIDLVSFYQNATLFVYASLSEGFGIPILEAFNSMCPVVASGSTSIPEVGGNAAIYINPLSQNELESAIVRCIREPSLCDSLRTKGSERARLFSWESVARQTYEVYMDCVDRRGFSA